MRAGHKHKQVQDRELNQKRKCLRKVKKAVKLRKVQDQKFDLQDTNILCLSSSVFIVLINLFLIKIYKDLARQAMTEFDLFSINNKMAVCEKKQKDLNGVKEKISKNSKELEVKSLERVNRVALFEVRIKHTSEYLVKMSSDYYAKVKTQNALDIISGRMKKVEEDMQKWRELKEKLDRNKKKQKSGLDFELGAGRNGLECSIDSVGENDEGQQIFNIVEFGEPQGLKREVNVFKDNKDH